MFWVMRFACDVLCGKCVVCSVFVSCVYVVWLFDKLWSVFFYVCCVYHEY